MGDNSEAEYTYAELLHQFRGRNNEAEVLYPLMDRIKIEVDLESAETCLSIGTGPGEYDIEFIKRCLPNLKRFIAVEMNADCVTLLRSNVEKSLPHLDMVIHQESIEEWKGPDCHVDVILVFHVFYYVKKEDRLTLMEKFQSWLRPQTGVVVNVHVSNGVEKDHIFRMIHNEMDEWVRPLEAEELKKEFISMGFLVHPDFMCQCTVDLRNVGTDMLNWIFHCQEINRSDETKFRKALAKVAPSGIGTAVVELFAVKRKQE